LCGGYVVRGVANQDCCAVVEVSSAGFLGSLAGDVNEVGAGIVVGSVSADVEVEMTRKVGIGHWHAHEGRHTAVSIMSSNGVPIQDISDTVGHKSPTSPRPSTGTSSGP
jgi:Phage integrase family